MDKIIDIKEEFGDVILTSKKGKKIKTKSKTTYTIYESGRKDCNVEIIKPLDLFDDSKQ